MKKEEYIAKYDTHIEKCLDCTLNEPCIIARMMLRRELKEHPLTGGSPEELRT